MESSYRLREQQIGRRWVYPYVTESAQHYQVTLAVVIGALETVDQEAPSLHAEVLDVELRNERDQPLEMVQRPEGLLTVVGGPSFTANANYRFLAEQVPAETLYVAIDGERVSFHLTRDRLVEKKSHKEWELWPLSRYLHFLGCKIICFLKKLFGKPRCCVSRFDPPIPRSGCQTGATFARESFHMNADFDSSGDCACRCCEYRQYVRGRFLENGQPARHQLPSGPLDPRVWQEDGVPHHFGAGQHFFYGHRAGPGTGTDIYQSPDRPTGCEYRGFDLPGIGSLHPSRLEVDLEFRGEIVDTCCCNMVVRSTTWRVRCQNYI